MSVYFNMGATAKFRSFCARGIRTGHYGLAIVSNGRRYRLGAVRIATNVVCFPKVFERLSDAQAECETRFPGVAVQRFTIPKAKKVATEAA